MDLLERLAAQRGVKHSLDCTILLDGELAQRRQQLLADLETASEERRATRASDADRIRAQLAELEHTAEEGLETFRFYRLPGKVWGDLALKYPPRPGIALDRLYGYNADALAMETIRYRAPKENPRARKLGQAYAFQLVDGVETEVSDEAWLLLFDVAAGSEFRKMVDTIWTLNEWGPQQLREAALKASGATARSAN